MVKRVIDADYLISYMEYAINSCHYEKTLIKDNLSVADVIRAVIQDVDKMADVLYKPANNKGMPTVEAIPKADYENRLKAERKKIAEDVADKMNYMGSCLNEKNIILGVITGKRETLDSLCSTCKSESCVSNGTAISKSDYEARLKADMVAMLRFLWNDIEDLDAPICDYASSDCISKWQVHELIQQKINSLKAESEDKK